MIEIIEGTANRILDESPGAVIRFRLLRDVLRRAPEDPELQKAKEALKTSQNIQTLAKEQGEDGGWGAFHSRSTKRRQLIPSTEVGVERGLALGLDESDPILEKAAGYILKIMTGELDFPDYHEKNDRWNTGMRLFLASTLSLIQPGHPILNRDRELWRSITRRTFESGKYSEGSEIKAHAELTGATVKNSYLVLNNRYTLNILGSRPGILSAELESALLGWLWERPDGIGYLGIPLNREPPLKTGPLVRWLSSLALLARTFPTSIRFARPSIEWLWAHQQDGTWDFGPRPSSVSFMPLSDNWRERKDRKFDWTTRVLILLRKFYEEIPKPQYQYRS